MDVNWEDNMLWTYGAGLGNLGHTCYANAMIQSLDHIPHVVGYFTRLKIEKKTERAKNYIKNNKPHQINSYGGTVYIENFIDKAPDFELGTDHDSHEFYDTLDNLLCEELNESISEKNFEMESTEKVVCISKRHSSKKFVKATEA